MFLDAPPEVILESKGEGTLAQLKARQHAFIKQGKKIPYFIKVNVTRSVDDICNEVSQHILQFYEKRAGRKADMSVTK
jgi:hypothetical protein